MQLTPQATLRFFAESFGSRGEELLPARKSTKQRRHLGGRVSSGDYAPGEILGQSGEEVPVTRLLERHAEKHLGARPGSQHLKPAARRPKPLRGHKRPGNPKEQAAPATGQFEARG
jgi:hypothetical protein